jgi:hypothetical protein
MLTKLTRLAAILGMVALVCSCVVDSTEPETGTGEPDFLPHTTDYSILVRNNTGENLVAFKGDLQANRLIGGIPAHAQNHGLPKNLELFDKTEDFPLILLTKTQYEANKSNLQSQKNYAFTRVYVFYNKSGDNTVVYELAEGLGGNNALTIVNPSTLNVELRVGGPAGETLGYAPAGITETVLKVNDGNYLIYPVFKRYNRTRDVVDTVYPKGGSGLPWYQTYSFGEGHDQDSMRLSELLAGLSMTSGVAWIVVDNQSESSGISFYEGAIPYRTASGLEYIPTNAPRTFQIDMPRASNNNYAESRSVSNWGFGTPTNKASLQTSATDTTPVTTFTVERDKMYTITVTGDHNAGTLEAYISSTTTVDVSDFNFN